MDDDALKQLTKDTAKRLFGTPKEKTNKTYFLAGMADLELKKYDDAIGKFQHIIATNALSGGNYYQDEAEFYRRADRRSRARHHGAAWIRAHRPRYHRPQAFLPLASISFFVVD